MNVSLRQRCRLRRADVTPLALPCRAKHIESQTCRAASQRRRSSLLSGQIRRLKFTNTSFTFSKPAKVSERRLRIFINCFPFFQEWQSTFAARHFRRCSDAKWGCCTSLRCHFLLGPALVAFHCCDKKSHRLR